MSEAHPHANSAAAVALDGLRRPKSDELRQQRQFLGARKLRFQPHQHGYKERSISDLVGNTENQLWRNPKLQSDEAAGGAKRKENQREEQRNAATCVRVEEKDEAGQHYSASHCENEQTDVDGGHDRPNDQLPEVAKLSRVLLSGVFDRASMPRPTTWQTWSDLETRHGCAFLERRGHLALRNRKLLHSQSTIESSAQQIIMSGSIETKPSFLQTSVCDTVSTARHHQLSRRICRFCNRQFPSGRALGGHMRVHGTDVHSTNTNTILKCRPSNSSNCEDHTLEYLELHRNRDKAMPLAKSVSKEPWRLQSRLENGPLYSSLKKRSDSSLDYEEDGGDNDTTKRLNTGYSSIGWLHSRTVRPRSAHDAFQAESNIRKPRPCSECGKVFWSWKALFGHMRCHPEREWRGMNFEIAAAVRKSSLLPKRVNFAGELLDADDCLQESGNSGNTNDLESDQDSLKEESEAECDCELEDFILRSREIDRRSGPRRNPECSTPAWPTRRRSKRMRSTITHIDQEGHMLGSLDGEGDPSSPAGSDEETDLHDLANCLVLLSASTAHRDSSGQQPTQVYESSYSNVGVVEDDTPSDEVGAEDNKQEPHSGTDRILSARTNGFKYECSTCKRCFKSHQALGGHRASHRKIKGCFTRPLDLQEGHENIWDSNFEDAEIMRFREDKRGMCISKKDPFCKKAIKRHGCSICHRIFPTGQALGGHKRCHWTGHEKVVDSGSTTNLSCSQLSDMLQGGSPGIASSATQNRKMQDVNNFDLNLPATVDEEDDEAAAKRSPLRASHRPMQPEGAGILNHQSDDITNTLLIRRISGRRSSSDKLTVRVDNFGAQFAYAHPGRAGEELDYAAQGCKAGLSSGSIHAADCNAAGEAAPLAPVVTACLPYYGDAILFNF